MRDYFEKPVRALFPEYASIFEGLNSSYLYDENGFWGVLKDSYYNLAEDEILKAEETYRQLKASRSVSVSVRTLLNKAYRDFSCRGKSSKSAKRVELLTRNSLLERGVTPSKSLDYNFMLLVEALLKERDGKEDMLATMRAVSIAVSSVTELNKLSKDISEEGPIKSFESLLRAADFYGTDPIKTNNKLIRPELRDVSRLASLLHLLEDKDLEDLEKISSESNEALAKGEAFLINRPLRSEIAFLTSCSLRELHPGTFIDVRPALFEEGSNIRFNKNRAYTEEDEMIVDSFVSREQDLYEYLVEKVLSKSSSSKSREEKLANLGQLLIPEKTISKIREEKPRSTAILASRDREYAVLRHLLETDAQALDFDQAQINFTRSIISDQVK